MINTLVFLKTVPKVAQSYFFSKTWIRIEPARPKKEREQKGGRRMNPILSKLGYSPINLVFFPGKNVPSQSARVNTDFRKQHPMPPKEDIFPHIFRYWACSSGDELQVAWRASSFKLRQIQTGTKGKDLGILTLTLPSNPSLTKSDSIW